MKNILLDTCILIHIVRDSESGKKCLQIIEDYDENPNIIISVVTKAEIDSFAVQKGWLAAKRKVLDNFLKEVIIMDISKVDSQLLTNYAMIDSFSKRKSPDLQGDLKTGSATKMGKNDLWIASTAATLDIPLITSDGDFDHLNGTFIRLLKV